MNWKYWTCIVSLCAIPLAGHAVTPQIAAGVSSTAVLKQDGTVWGVGFIDRYFPGAMQPTRMFPGIADATSISLPGSQYVLRANGELWVVGANYVGTTGGPTGDAAPVGPDPYKVLDNVIQFSAFHTTMMAVQSDGTVSAWGGNAFGQLGDGTRIARPEPVKVNGLTNVVMVAAGLQHSAALTADGHVWAWGHRESFADGDPWDPDRYSADDPRSYALTPMQVPNLSGIVSIAAGGFANLALDADGKLWSHGKAWTGMLGNGLTGNPTNLPVAVSVPGKVTAFSVGESHDLALIDDGSVWAWGGNTSGQLGLPFSGTNPTPAKITLPGPALDVAAGWRHSVVLLADGRVMTFGDDSNSQLGRGVFQSDYAPGIMVAETGSGSFSALTLAPVNLHDAPSGGISAPGAVNETVKGFVPLAVTFTALGSAAGGHAIVSYDWVGSDGAILGQGQSISLNFTQPGTIDVYGVVTDDTGLKRATSTHVMALPPDVALSIAPQIVSGHGGRTFNALSSAGAVFSWGAPWLLGLPTVQGSGLEGSSLLPVDPGLRGIVKIASAGGTSFALTQGGLVLAWGFNYNGSLGTGSGITWAPEAVLVSLPRAAIDVVSYDQTYALLNDGTVWAWGANEVGQLGLADTSARNKPEQIPGLANIAAIVATPRNGYAVDRDGNIWAWGDNTLYQLGQGDTTQRLGIVKVGGLPPIAKVVAGDWHVLAIARDGRVFGWSNWRGSLGDPSLPDTKSPVQVPALSGFTDFVSNASYTLGVKSDGSVWTWGSNSAGQMPGTTAQNELSPIPVAGVMRPLSMSANNIGGAIVGNDGYVLTWGMNNYGQIGDGTMARRRTPVAVVNQTADGFLNLLPGTNFELPPSVGVPFFLVAAGGITDSSATVYTRAKFNGGDVGKTGKVFVTAAVPPGSLVAASSPMSASGSAAGKPISNAVTGSAAYVLVNLTDLGWKEVTNGQLLPYATGVLDDQLSAQKILDNTDTSNLKGAQFCLGYGIDAAQMVATGRMRVVASIPDPSASGAAAVSCLVAGPPVNFSLTLPQGWSLLGNSLNQSFTVSSLFNDANSVTSVWKWDANTFGWQFYTPSMDAAALQTYAANKGYAVLATINPGEGYWVNAKAPPTIGTQSGDSFMLTGMSLARGWNLVATGNDILPSEFNANLKASAVPASLKTLWAWDNAQSAWYFYAPSLEAQGGTALSGYIAGKGYLDFSSNNKTLGSGTGFWVNR